MGRFIIVLILCTACGANWHLKRGEFHRMKAIQLGAVVNSDTVYVNKEVIVPQFVGDTVLVYGTLSDTVTVVQDRVTTKIKYNTVDRNVYVKTLVKADTVYLRVPVSASNNVKAGYSFWYLIGCIAIGLCLGAVGAWFASK